MRAVPEPPCRGWFVGGFTGGEGAALLPKKERPYRGQLTRTFRVRRPQATARGWEGPRARGDRRGCRGLSSQGRGADVLRRVDVWTSGENAAGTSH